MTRDLHVIVGLGATGFSCARFLKKQNIPFAITDSRVTPPQLDAFKNEFPDVLCSVGQIDESLLSRAEKIVVSPGISLLEPKLAKEIGKGTPTIGDIELFALNANAPVVAITGTNAKSTVTTLVGEMAKTAGKKVKVGGNLGIPALDLLTSAEVPDLYVLELSSFQLETTYSLSPSVATVLNITPDHMDRYNVLEEYCAAKHRVYNHCEVAVCNRDDHLTECKNPQTKKIHFTLHDPYENEFGLLKKGTFNYLAFENKILMPVKELPILGRHYQANALAALAIGHGFGLPFTPMLQTLIDFKGLPHRCQLIRERNGVCWYNDSKGTNVGATLAAIEGLGAEMEGKLILIAGGVGKNADFSPLVPVIEKYVRTVILIGEAAQVLADLIGDRVEIRMSKTMEEAVKCADEAACPGDSILLSPACASFDMFNNFEHRGTVFTNLVKAI